MVVTEQMSRSNKSVHKNSSDKTKFNSPPKKKSMSENQESDSSSEEQDDSETDLDKPLYKMSSQGKSFPPQKQVPSAQNANGGVSDSETDIDKPPRQSVNTKHVVRTETAGSSGHSQSVAPQSSDDEDDDSEDQIHSMSLLQTRNVNISPVKRLQQSPIKSFQQLNDKGLVASGLVQGKVSRRPNVPEMSPSEAESESESDSEAEDAPQPQRKSGREPEEDEAGKEQQRTHISTPDHLQSVNVKKELESPQESSSYEEEEDSHEPRETETGTRTPASSAPQESQNQRSRNVSSREMPPAGNSAAALRAFEEEHTPLSTPVIDIPPDSRVWFLQIPRSVQASHLQGIHLPGKLRGGEVLDLPTGRWKLLNQPYEKSRSNASCITSTGYMSYGIHWLQPEAFWFLKKMPHSVHAQTGDEPWDEDVTPIPITELLQMKSKVSTKTRHSKKRPQDSSDVPSGHSRVLPQGSRDTDQQSPRKKKMRLHLNEQGLESSTTGDDAEVGKKRKRLSESSEVSPSKKKKKHSLAESGDAHKSINSTTEEDSSLHKRKKKKHKEHGETSVKSVSSPVSNVRVKLECACSDDEQREHSSSKLQLGSPGGKKHKKQSRVELEHEDESSYMETEPNENGASKKKKKKKRRKGEKKDVKMDQPMSTFVMEGADTKHTKMDKRSKTSLVDTEASGRKEKKKKRVVEEGADVGAQTNEKDSVAHFSVSPEKQKKKKKKHKHKEKEKDFEQVKIKQEEDSWWERETSPDVLKRLYLTQVTPEDV